VPEEGLERPRRAGRETLAPARPRQRLAWQRLLRTRLVRVSLGRFEKLTELLSHLRRVLVTVHGGGVLSGRTNDLFLLADDR